MKVIESSKCVSAEYKLAIFTSEGQTTYAFPCNGSGIVIPTRPTGNLIGVFQYIYSDKCKCTPSECGWYKTYESVSDNPLYEKEVKTFKHVVRVMPKFECEECGTQFVAQDAYDGIVHCPTCGAFEDYFGYELSEDENLY